MGTVKHKILGMAKIIRRDGDRITIKYDKDGKEVELKFPDSFITKPCLFVLDAELQREVDEAVATKKEAARIERESREAQRAMEQAQNAKNPVVKTGRTSKTPAKIKIKDTIEKDFEEYLIASGYSVETPSGNPSTVNSYITAVNSILEDEGVTWNSLITQISKIVLLYSEGGEKEDIGSKSNYTYLNALRRFADFVDNSTL